MTIALVMPPRGPWRTLLHALVDTHRGRIVTSSNGRHATATPVVAARIVVDAAQVDIETLPIPSWDATQWEPLLRRADAIVACVDTDVHDMKALSAILKQVQPYAIGRPHAVLLASSRRARGEVSRLCAAAADACSNLVSAERMLAIDLRNRNSVSSCFESVVRAITSSGLVMA